MNDYSLIFEAYSKRPKREAKEGDRIKMPGRKRATVIRDPSHRGMTEKQLKDLKPVKESVEAHKLPQSLQQINTEISALFQKHGINVGQGSDAFWIGVQDVLRMDRADGKRLQKLAQDWETAHKRENVVKPHLEAPAAPTAI